MIDLSRDQVVVKQNRNQLQCSCINAENIGRNSEGKGRVGILVDIIDLRSDPDCSSRLR